MLLNKQIYTHYEIWHQFERLETVYNKYTLHKGKSASRTYIFKRPVF